MTLTKEEIEQLREHKEQMQVHASTKNTESAMVSENAMWKYLKGKREYVIRRTRKSETNHDVIHIPEERGELELLCGTHADVQTWYRSEPIPSAARNWENYDWCTRCRHQIYKEVNDG
jgi:hypothetical protein